MGNQVRIQGAVLIEITVAKSGEPKEIHALEGHPMLIAATIDAAKQWRFQPYRFNGKRVEVSTQFYVIFVLTPRSGYHCKIKSPHAATRVVGAAGKGRIG